MRPEGENKCIIGLSAAAVQAEFEIGQGTVTLVKFSSGNKPPVKGLQDKLQKKLDSSKEDKLKLKRKPFKKDKKMPDNTGNKMVLSMVTRN